MKNKKNRYKKQILFYKYTKNKRQTIIKQQGEV